MSRPDGSHVQSILDVVRTVYRDTTEMELKREVDYLKERELVELKVDPLGEWSAKLDRYGVDVVEYSVECEPGIARPRFGS